MLRAMIPPRWSLRIGWALHRALTRMTRGRLGIAAPTSRRLGTLFLTTVGHRSGEPRRVGLFYLQAGETIAVVASNAGAPTDPAWWRHLQARPEATVELAGPGGPITRPVRARAADPAERDAWYARFTAVSSQYAAYARATDRTIDVVLPEPVAPAPSAEPA